MTSADAVEIERIRHTITQYTIAGDDKTPEVFTALFAKDAVFEFEDFPPLPGFRFEGRSAIDPTARWERIKRSMRTSFVRHNLGTCQIELTGPDTAKARTYFIVFTDIGPDHSGVYTDELVKVADEWLFAHRKIRLDWRSPQGIYP